MRLTFDQIESWFGEYLWFLANHYRRGIVEAADIYQNLLVLIFEQDWEACPTECRHTGYTLPINPGHVNRFASSRTLDMVRSESRRTTRVKAIGSDVPDRSVIHAPEGDADDNYQRLVTTLREHLSTRDFDIIMAKAFPDERILQVAQTDRQEALADRANGALRMNVHNEIQITGSHVARGLGYSPATVSRALKKAKKILSKPQAA